MYEVSYSLMGGMHDVLRASAHSEKYVEISCIKLPTKIIDHYCTMFAKFYVPDDVARLIFH